MRKKPIAAALFALSLAVLGLACDGLTAKFAACQTDGDCPTPDGGKLVCFNQRCLECHYDSDCPEGKVCGTANTCESLDSRTPENEPLPPPETLEECAKRCKGNSSCGDSCRYLFSDAGAGKEAPKE